MKKCPACQKTFDDSLRFCQADGTPLVDDAPVFDPYATIVSSQIAPPAAEPPSSEPDPPDQTPLSDQTVGSLPITPPEDVLELPEADPLKTMYASDAEMKEILDGAVSAPPSDASSEVEPGPSAAASGEPSDQDMSAPEPPSFSDSEPPVPGLGDMAPPPSPFSGAETIVDIPPAAPPEPPPSRPFEQGFDEAATIIQPHMTGNLGAAPPPAPVAEWTPPPAPDTSWQNQQVGSNTPFQPPAAGTGAQSQGLAIASLVCGIASLLCCSWFIVGIAAVVMGFIARGKANSDPANYGGAGLALAGMITGGISVLLGVVFWVLYVLGFMASLMTR
jgi:hypothetical protein